jgi:hypothetical protein
LGTPKLPSKKALDFLTAGKPGKQSIAKFGELTPIGRTTRKTGPFG